MTTNAPAAKRSDRTRTRQAFAEMERPIAEARDSIFRSTFKRTPTPRACRARQRPSPRICDGLYRVQV
jgi:hypothetical protein